MVQGGLLVVVMKLMRGGSLRWALQQPAKQAVLRWHDRCVQLGGPASRTTGAAQACGRRLARRPGSQQTFPTAAAVGPHFPVLVPQGSASCAGRG